MSRRDELAAVLGNALRETRMTAYEDGKGGWLFRDAKPDEQAVPIANAVLAWLGEQLGDEGLLETVAETVCVSEPTRLDRVLASRALTAVREWFGVAE